MEEYPREVRAPPLLLAALVGATPLHAKLTEALHESAMEACGQRRIRYLSFSYDMRIPPCRRGARDAPGYRVGGILKRRWLEKVCSGVPAVLVVCFDWSQDPSLPQQEEAQAQAHLQHAKRQARDRELRLVVFAVLHEDSHDPEGQCSALRQLPEGAVLIVARGQRTFSSKAHKLEQVIYQQAIGFYADEEKRHRKQWTPKQGAVPVLMQSAMQVRANFKVAFLSEFRRDARGALKSYIKAYEQLIHDVDVADPIERMALCSHITIRMYQRYLQSHDVTAAVHHCRIHTATLRRCCPDDEGLVWQKWHRLAANHQLFAELLESVAQQLPLLIDQGDLWQFPGFHYQAAASYCGRLQRWASEARDAFASGRLSMPTRAGGDLVPTPYLGQVETLERPEECLDAAREVMLRLAHIQAFEVLHGDRRLQLLTRAQAAYKERGYTAGAATCTARIAEEYLRHGNLVAAPKLFDRLRRKPLEADYRLVGPWPLWPPLQRLALERALLCSLRQLGITEVPEVCSASRATPPVPADPELGTTAVQETGSFRDRLGSQERDAEDEAAATAALRRRLLADAFQYLALTRPEGGVASKAAAEAASQHNELLAVVATALAIEPAFVAEVSLEHAVAEVGFDVEGAGDCFINVKLRNPLAATLEVGSVVALTSEGEVELSRAGSATAGQWLHWEADSLLELRGRLPSAAASQSELHVLAVRLAWRPGPGVALSVRQLRPRGRPEPLLPPLRLPGAGAEAAVERPHAAEAGVSRLGAERPAIRAEVFAPVDPLTALAGETFVFHVAIFARALGESSASETTAATRLWASCTVKTQEESDEAGTSQLAEAFLLQSTAQGGGWVLLPFPGEPQLGQVVAELSEGGKLTPLGPILALAAEQVSDGPPRPATGETPLVLPVAVRCSRNAHITASVRIWLAGATGEAAGAPTVLPAVQIRFRPALLASFEAHDRSLATSAAKHSGSARRFALRSQTAATVELLSVGVPLPGDGGAERTTLRALGVLGRVAQSASYAFVLPQLDCLDPENPPVLEARFVRADAAEVFFPWSAARTLLPVGSLPPPAVAEWPLPQELIRPVPLPGLRVELEHGSTGAVAEPLEVKVRVRRSAHGSEELKVRVIRGEGSEGSEKYFLSGCTTTQAVLLSAFDPPSQVCSSFTLVPLRPGWLSVPRVQVSSGPQEATSASSTIFIFPSVQPAVWRPPA